MLFWVFVILIFLGVIGAIWADNQCVESLCVIGMLVSVISGIVSAIMLFTVITAHCTAGAQVELGREQYKALTYKMESGACRDEFGLLSKEIIDEIQHWNEDVAYNKRIQRDFWMGIFYPNVFDEFETIDYERYRDRE